jgi:glycosyltransferase involved in cell wall biosynthesis
MPDDSPARAFRQRLAITMHETAVFSEVMDEALAAALLAESSARAVRLLLTESASLQVSVLPQRDQLAQFSVSLSRDHHEAAIAAADVIIADSEETVATAMTHGRPSLAIDKEEIRALSPDGAGLIWCDGNSAQDRARRLGFLLKDRDMRESLGASARAFIVSARSLERIGKMYEEVYRYAAQARTTGKSLPPDGTLVPVNANL